MVNNSNPVYRRILLKLSGEALQGIEGFGINECILDRISLEIKDLIQLGVEVGIVIGGGNLFRGSNLANSGMNRVVADHIGILATIMNGLAMRDALDRACVNAHLMSAIPLNSICDNYNYMTAINLLKNNYVVIFAAGTGNPLFTTDSAACLRGIEIKSDIMLKATQVNGVYSSDPKKDPNAILYEKLTYNEVLEQELKIMDVTAFTLARDYKLLIRVFNINKLGALRCIIMGEKEGTLITY